MTNKQMIKLIDLANKGIITNGDIRKVENESYLNHYYRYKGKYVAVCTNLGDNEFHLVVHPKCRNRGIGKKFLKRLIKEYKGSVIICTVDDFYNYKEGTPIRSILMKLGFSEKTYSHDTNDYIDISYHTLKIKKKKRRYKHGRQVLF